MGKRGQPKHRIHRQSPSQPNARGAGPGIIAKAAARPDAKAAQPKDWLLLILFWSYVLLPLAWGVTATVRKAALLFK